MLEPLWLKAVIKALVLPPTGLLLVAALGLALRARLPRTGRSLVAAGILGLLVISIPVTADFLTTFVDTSPVLALEDARNAQAIVILGGGIRRDAPEYGGDTLGTLTLERVRYGARVARLTGLPVLVTGGTVLARRAGSEAHAGGARERIRRSGALGRGAFPHDPRQCRALGRDAAEGWHQASRARRAQFRHAARDRGVRGARHRNGRGPDRKARSRRRTPCWISCQAWAACSAAITRRTKSWPTWCSG